MKNKILITSIFIIMVLTLVGMPVEAVITSETMNHDDYSSPIYIHPSLRGYDKQQSGTGEVAAPKDQWNQISAYQAFVQLWGKLEEVKDPDRESDRTSLCGAQLK